MPDFDYDVFLSYSSKDKAVVLAIAEELRADGLKVWFDEWVLKAGDSIPAKIEEGLERSRVLVLCMSEHALRSDWARLESYTFRFRDPLNIERRFIPLRLDDAPIKGLLTQFLYINWQPPVCGQEYERLLEACRHPNEWPNPSPDSGPGGKLRSTRVPAPLPEWQVRYFQDRIAELATLKRCLENKSLRLVLICGRGGAGKTALAVKSLCEVKEHSRAVDGIVYVP